MPSVRGGGMDSLSVEAHNQAEEELETLKIVSKETKKPLGQLVDKFLRHLEWVGEHKRDPKLSKVDLIPDDFYEPVINKYTEFKNTQKDL